MSKLNGLLPKRLRASYALKFAAVLTIIALMTGGVAAYSYTEIEGELETQVDNELITSTETEAGATARWVDQRAQTARMLSEYEVMTNDLSEVRAFLNAEMSELPDDVRDVHYVDAGTNEILASTNGERAGERPTGETAAWAAAERSFDGADSVFRSNSFRSDGNPTIAWVSPVPGHENRLVVVSVDTMAASEALSTSVRGGFTQVIDGGDGEVMMDETGENIDGEYTLGTDVRAVKQGAEGEVGIASMDPVEGFLNEPFLAAYAPVEGTDWVVVTHAPKRTAYALASKAGSDMLLLVGGALLGLVVVGLTIGRTTVSSLNDLKAKAKELEGGNLDVDTSSGRSDEIGQLYGAFGAMRDSLRGQITEMQETTDNLERRADEYSAVMSNCADGDLTQRLTPDGENEAMHDIAESFNRMLDELEGTVVRIKNFADEVAASSEEATTSTEEIQQASEEVSRSVQEIADGSAEQNADLQRASEEMTALSASVEEVASAATQVAATSEQAAVRGADARSFAKDAIVDMNEAEAQTELRVEEVESLNQEIKQINDIVNMINAIAEQTNLLALNASIEAAGAGEAGKGFAVVAEEIKDLAGQASDATDEIETLIGNIVTSTEETKEEMRETGDSVSGGVETVEQALEALEEVVEAFEETNRGVQEIDDTTGEQARSTDQVVGMIDDVSSVSTQTAAETQNVSAASEEQTSSLSEVGDSVRALSSRASRLHTLLDEFEVSDGTGSPRPNPVDAERPTSGPGPSDAPTTATADGGVVSESSTEWEFARAERRSR